MKILIAGIVTALVLLLPVAAVHANAFASANKKCNVKPKKFLCTGNPTTSPVPLKMLILAEHQTPQTLKELRLYNDNPNLTWRTLVPPQSRVVLMPKIN